MKEEKIEIRNCVTLDVIVEYRCACICDALYAGECKVGTFSVFSFIF